MEFLLVFVLTAALTVALREPLRRWPIAFYAVAAVVVVVFFAGIDGLLFGMWWRPLIVLVQRCMMALSLFTVVMFIGVLSKGSRFDAWLRPVRAEVSIVACILRLGHMCVYLAPFATRACGSARPYGSRIVRHGARALCAGGCPRRCLARLREAAYERAHVEEGAAPGLPFLRVRLAASRVHAGASRHRWPGRLERGAVYGPLRLLCGSTSLPLVQG